MSKVSIGICAYNEENNIGRLLDNLLAKQELPRNSEILVICSGCTDLTPEIVRKFHERDDRVKLIVEDDRKGKASALNILFDRVRHTADILILVNADTLPEIGSVNKLIHSFSDKNVGATGGRPIPVNEPQSLANHLTHLIWSLHHKVSSYKKVKLSGELCAIRSSLVEKIPTNLVTDEPYIEMLIRRQGYKVTYLPDAVVNIKGPDNPRELLKQRRRIWIGHLQIEKMTGFTVSTSDPRNVLLSILMEKSRLNVKKLPHIVLGAILEMCAYLLAQWDFSRGKVPYRWEPIESTKKLY